ncbi:hypothetical protein NEUTE1DRAFT_118004 [Neurospora tetrasperma FGSC 2508]|uniref:Uncharacterized protein n=1 Tax=Neurospora tetrasperma (strain FGSC 2508 / ATCC MYA-4615 / P0657) TaxID=510951 RepID=F8MVA1_NEUT8|nr:uncharacterized protein NEUTE1DRAFT_118004 [Neurospora tetrasperma FGSC 2508]EGO53906.1 hypothetical protein NEUTE1DRAFT_118004 [Neurospora tetrasperma FGSC 2508]
MSDDNSIPAKDTYPPAQFMDLAHIAWAQAGGDCRITPPNRRDDEGNRLRQRDL